MLDKAKMRGFAIPGGFARCESVNISPLKARPFKNAAFSAGGEKIRPIDLGFSIA